MLEVLVAKYRDQDRIYLSWDAASWQASKAFIKRVDSINVQRVSPASSAPRVKLAPLPSGCIISECHRAGLQRDGPRCYSQQQLRVGQRRQTCSQPVFPGAQRRVSDEPAPRWQRNLGQGTRAADLPRNKQLQGSEMPIR